MFYNYWMLCWWNTLRYWKVVGKLKWSKNLIASKLSTFKPTKTHITKSSKPYEKLKTVWKAQNHEKAQQFKSSDYRNHYFLVFSCVVSFETLAMFSI